MSLSPKDKVQLEKAIDFGRGLQLILNTSVAIPNLTVIWCHIGAGCLKHRVTDKLARNETDGVPELVIQRFYSQPQQ